MTPNLIPRHDDARIPPAQTTQVAGTHYRDMPIQPAAFILANGIGWAEGSVIEYVVRHKVKNGVEDLKKARHLLDMLIEHEEGK